MAQVSSHSHARSSTARLSTLSRTAQQRAGILRRLADDLELHDATDTDGDIRLAAVVEVLFEGTDANLSREDLEHLLRLDVPRALVAGAAEKGSR